MAATAVVDRPQSGSDWARRYPPLVSIAVALLIALVVLPSALNLPQSNPSTTLEFAPVPPEDDAPPPPPGNNLGELGLGSTSGLEQGGALGGTDTGQGLPPDVEELPPPGDPPAGIGKTASTKRCVGNPPRQTEDPLSPPCVADFQGDNFGATYQGVTSEEVKILIYVQGNINYVNICKDPNQATPNGQYFDLGQEPTEEEHCAVRTLRVWQRSFNERYQTYKRFVRFIVYFSGRGDSAEERKADAADNYNQVKPFAVISYGSSFGDDYLESMAKRGVLNFGSFAAREATFFQKYPKLIWGYLPSLEIQASIFVGWVCKQVAPFPTSSSQNPGQNGQPRKYGYWATKDKARPELIKLAALIKTELKEKCGVEFAAEHYFPYAGFAQDNRNTNREAQAAVADMAGKGVTTVIWPGGLDTTFTKTAAGAQYRPEFISLGDGTLDTDANSIFQEQSVWTGAYIATQATRLDDQRQGICYKAYREADPDGDDAEIRAEACDYYNDLRQLFTGIQVAGPRLGPTSIDKGFRAIPKIKSTNPEVPACFYEPGDYTCVKDAMVERWDRNAENGQGCYRMREGGQRYFADIWPDEDVSVSAKPDDPCNTFGSSYVLNPAPPSRDDI